MREDDQYQPAGSEPVVSKPPIAARFLEQHVQLGLGRHAPVLVAVRVELRGVFACLVEGQVSGASFGVVYIGLPVSGDTPA